MSASPPSPLETLLPALGTAPRCSPFTQASRFDPGGSAIDVDAVICIDIPLPWPKPVFDHPWLASARSVAPTALGPTRILARVPADDELPRATVWCRDGAATQASTIELGDADGIASFVAELAEQRPAGLVADEAERDAILVCVQGSHDHCCGDYGPALADELDAAGYRVHRVSHTGGHRFAPTVMTTNDGRMWAWVQASDMAVLTSSQEIPADLVARCRGWWGASSGPSQVGERAVWGLVGRRLDSLARTVTVATVDANDDPQRWHVVVSASSGERWEVTLARGRLVPSIACEQPGGLPYKVASEFTVVDGPRLAPEIERTSP